VTVRVRLFAVLRDRSGIAELSLDLPDGATVAQAKEPLLERLPALREYLGRCGYAVNYGYVRADAPLHDGDELALIPPVSGG
jgi:molybdopterin converting factor subunit 1